MQSAGLKNWMIHRAKTVKLVWPHGVADAAGIEPATLALVEAIGNLRHVGRSARSYLARALKVSVRELESLDAGRIDWIGDERIVDFDLLSINASKQSASDAPIALPCPKHRGVPILGRILATGIVEHFDDWTPEDGPRLAVRYAGVPDAFALQIAADFPPFAVDTCLVFQVIPQGQLMDDQLALLTHGHGEVVTELCVVRREGHALRRCAASQQGLENAFIAITEIHRAARVIGCDSDRAG
jgi:hypothetical protein